ncbi:MAG TPA: hypothetical protein VGJ31_03045 [Dongiaceae bacterium]
MTDQEIMGERRLRQFLCALDLLAFAAIAAVALYIWRFWPRGHDVYSDLQQSASETYLLTWMGVALIAALTALGRRTRLISFALSFLLLMECLAQLYFFSANHHPYHPNAQAILNRFEPHPLLVGIPHPSTFGGLSHDAMHRRTTVNEGKASEARLIYVFGGSLAYDVGVIDSETWASDLSRLLGPRYEVQNYGVPGYGSLEAMIQSLFVFRDVKPACAVYYEGAVDLTLAHAADLSSDYAPDHQAQLLELLGVGYRPSGLANNWLFFQLVERAITSGPKNRPSPIAVSAQQDMRLSQIFTDNMRLIAGIDRHFGVTPILVPQVLNYDFIETHYERWWPGIPAQAVQPMMHEMNLDLERAAKDSGAVFLDAPLNIHWESGDFLDPMHFSAVGTAKFAQVIAPGIAMNCK